MLRRRDPFAEMFESWRDFDTLFRRIMGGVPELPVAPVGRRLLQVPRTGSEFLPAVECFTKDKELILRAELPGVDPKQVEVSIVGNTLLIKGEKKEERQVREEEIFFREIAQGRFERSFELPEGVKKEQIRASLQSGVLEVILPAAAIEPARKVPVDVLEAGKKTVKAA
jgi:HSP20 family protein